MKELDPSTVVIVPECLRPLKWNERVERGDFVEDGHGGFELWEGPNGFRADAFIKQIYRQQEGPPAKPKE